MYIFARAAYTCAAVFCILTACSKQNGVPEKLRPHDPWVFRSALDSVPRLITLALHDKLWVAYHTDSCSIYKVWRDGVDFVGAVYNQEHGPQPMSLGDAYFENRFKSPWFFVIDKQHVAPSKIQYRGHVFSNGQARLVYELLTPTGQQVKVTEQPEFVIGTSQNIGLERTFRVEGLPEGVGLGLRINVSSVATPESVSSTGRWQVTQQDTNSNSELSAVHVEGLLFLESGKPTVFKTMFVAEPTVSNQRSRRDGEALAQVHPGLQLINKSDCQACHNPEVMTVGPAYVDIAKKYPPTAANRDYLIHKVKHGGSGVWGMSVMTAHPQLSEEQIGHMIDYIFTLSDGDHGAGTAVKLKAPDPTAMKNSVALAADSLYAGFWVKAYRADGVSKVSEINTKAPPIMEGPLSMINAGGGDFKDLTENFALVGTGFLDIPQDNNYLFRLNSDDGAQLIIDNVVVCDNDGLHGDYQFAEGEIQLKKGLHPFKFTYFNGPGGRAMRLQWRSFDDGELRLVPASVFKHKKSDRTVGATALTMGQNSSIPGDRNEPTDVHPSYDVFQARPDDFMPRVGGLDMMPDGRLVVATWDPTGSVYIVKNPEAQRPQQIKVTHFARGLAEPLGIKVYDNDIYVLQKQELTRLRDLDRDGVADEYYTVCNGWKVSANFHEFAFGLVEKDGFLYATLATAIQAGGSGTRPQVIDRGRVIKINPRNGTFEFVAQGLRTPNGIGIGPDNQIFVSDNQGDWLPSSKIVHVTPGAFFGSYTVDSARQALLPVSQPVVWLPHEEISNSPSQPAIINEGLFKGQMMYGDVTHGGLKRVFVEKINNSYQGVVFRFIQGLEAGINRICYGKDGSIYVGGIGNPGNWGQANKLWYGLQRLKYNGKPSFEMLAVRAKSNGFEIEMTEPLEPGTGLDPAEYTIKQWYYQPTRAYGGPKLGEQTLRPSKISVSADGYKICLEIPGLKPNHVVYIRLTGGWISQNHQSLWSTEAWYTLNHIPANQPITHYPPTETVVPNTLTAAEKKDGWQLLFDGKSTAGWHTYGKKTAGKAWKVEDQALTLDESQKDGWQIKDGGDLLTDKAYTNYILELEWRIRPCGNSGIIYRVHEDPQKYEYCWMTGPEMQVLDNSCHSDGQFEKHRAGDLYDLRACTFETVKPAGQWNQLRIMVNNDRVEHWLNGYKVVAYTDQDMTKLKAQSKFKDWKGFAAYKTGHIALQDHGDRVQYRNIKIKPL